MDAVSLIHFARVGRLDLLKTRYESLREPRWTEAVKEEISCTPQINENRLILAAKWLGAPIKPNRTDHHGVQNLRIALGGGPSDLKHLGESESIHFAMNHEYHFLTDDFDAYNLACKKLGQTRTFDTIKVLIDAFSMGEIDLEEAASLANSIRNSGRYLLDIHPTPVTATYLDSLTK